jgi:PAS domain S-box-containing protein
MADIVTSDNPGPIIREYRINRADGKECWIAERSYPVFDTSDKPYRIAGIAADITDRKLAELDSNAARQSLKRSSTPSAMR